MYSEVFSVYWILVSSGIRKNIVTWLSLGFYASLIALLIGLGFIQHSFTYQSVKTNSTSQWSCLLHKSEWASTPFRFTYSSKQASHMCHQVGQRFSDHATLLKDGFLSCVKAENVIFFIVHSSLYKEFFTLLEQLITLNITGYRVCNFNCPKQAKGPKTFVQLSPLIQFMVTRVSAAIEEEGCRRVNNTENHSNFFLTYSFSIC